MNNLALKLAINCEKRSSASFFICKRRSALWGYWVTKAFNIYDKQRADDIGSERACAEWVIKCGGSVKWSGSDQFANDYDSLKSAVPGQKFLESIDATDSCVMVEGFQYIKNLERLKEIKFNRSYHIRNHALRKLADVTKRLERLEVISCLPNDDGLKSLENLGHLKYLRLADLPYAKNIDETVQYLKQVLPDCKVDYEIFEKTFTRPTWRDMILGWRK